MTPDDGDRLDDARAHLRSGTYLPLRATPSSRLVVVVAVEHGPEQLGQLATELAELQVRRLNFRPVLLTGHRGTDRLSAFGFLFETVIDEVTWAGMDHEVSYQDYLRQRVEAMTSVYAPARVLHAVPGHPLPAWLLP